MSAGKTAAERGVKAVSTIRARLLLMSAALLLPFAALLSYQGYRDFSDERKAAATAAVRLAEITAAKVSYFYFVSDTQTALASLSRRPLVRALDPRQCDPALGDYLDSHPYFTNVLTVDLSVRVVCSAAAVPPGTARVPRAIWMDRLIQSGQFTLGKPYLGPISGKWVVALAYPLRDRRGRIAGAVSLPVDLAHFRLSADKATLMSGTDIRIVTGDGTTVASLDLPRCGQRRWRRVVRDQEQNLRRPRAGGQQSASGRFPCSGRRPMTLRSLQGVPEYFCHDFPTASSPALLHTV